MLAYPATERSTFVRCSKYAARLRLLALGSAAAGIVRRDTISSGSTAVFGTRVDKLCIKNNALCALVGDLAVPVLPMELWPLVRTLAVLSPASKGYSKGRSLVKRGDKEALYEHSSVLFCASASGSGGTTPFGAITIGGILFADALLNASAPDRPAHTPAVAAIILRSSLVLQLQKMELAQQLEWDQQLPLKHLVNLRPSMAYVS